MFQILIIAMLQIDHLTVRIGERILLEDAVLRLDGKWRVGLVGRNGAGKSTLFKILRGEMEAETGAAHLQPGLEIASLAQDAPAGEATPLDHVIAGDRRRAALLKAMETAAGEELADLHERARVMGIDAAPARAAAILSGLGFDEAAQNRPLKEFSGGWRMRAALAAVLASGADWLLLDEPTNHLDVEAALWLESFLAEWRGGFLLISHDRGLLNRAVSHIVHLQDRKLTLYRGGYDEFERQRRERQALQAALRSRQENERAHLQAFIDRFRAKASKARQAQSRIKRLEKMEPIAEIIEDPSSRFLLPQAEDLAPPLIVLENTDVGYAPSAAILKRLDLRIDPDDRIALLGANGNGKSTFAKLLSGALAPMAGRVIRHKKLRVGYFAQHQEEELTLDATPVAHLARKLPDWTEDRLRARLGQFGLAETRAVTEVQRLSGGEKARLLFALATAEAPNLLILDEPTNHLDVDAREALVQALNGYAGAVVIVSHDRHLLDLVADRLWLVANGRVAPYDGDLADYERKILDDRRRTEAGQKNQTAAGPSRRDERRHAAERRARAAPLKKELDKAEAALEQLWQDKQKLDTELADPVTYDGRPDKLANLTKRHGELSAHIAKAEDRWLAAQAAYEAALSSIAEDESAR